MPRRDVAVHLPEWIQDHALSAGAGIAVLSIVLSLLIASVVLVRLPQDHFAQDDDRPHFPSLPPGLRHLAVFLKNVVGVAVIALGVVLSLPGVPGQGILTILLGLMLVDVPGRRRLERRVVAHPSVQRGINRLRARFGRPPLHVAPSVSDRHAHEL